MLNANTKKEQLIQDENKGWVYLFANHTGSYTIETTPSHDLEIPKYVSPKIDKPNWFRGSYGN